MNNISIDISGRIEPGRVSVLRSIKEVAEELDIHFFVVGAFARDVIFEHIHQIPAPRVTEDIDIGVEVASWEEFQRLTGALIERRLLTATKSPHRFIAGSFAAVVDIVPYGGISGETKRISWPPDHDMIMSMLGFEEAYQSALKVRLSSEPPLEILVPSVPALAFLKIISWADAYAWLACFGTILVNPASHEGRQLSSEELDVINHRLLSSFTSGWYMGHTRRWSLDAQKISAALNQIAINAGWV